MVSHHSEGLSEGNAGLLGVIELVCCACLPIGLTDIFTVVCGLNCLIHNSSLGNHIVLVKSLALTLLLIKSKSFGLLETNYVWLSIPSH
jgi:hypothetical protein